MKIRKRNAGIGLIIAALFFITGCNSACNKQSCQWKPLFEGDAQTGNYKIHIAGLNDYSGKLTFEDMFEFDGDDIRVLYKWNAENAPYVALYTKQEYSSYDVKFQYKWGSRKFKPRKNAKLDAGLLLHIHEFTPNSWPRCIECQVQEGDTGDIWLIGSNAVALTEDGEAVKFDNPDAPFKNGRRYHLNENDDWNEVLVKVRGDSATYYVNGMLVNQFKSSTKMETGSPLSAGHIGIQSEAAEVTYRNVMIRQAKP